MKFLKGYTTYTGAALLILAGVTEIISALNDGAISLADIEGGLTMIGAGVAAFGFRRNMNEKEVTEIGVKK